jgi:hypothetical protein
VDDIFAYPAFALGVAEHGPGIDSHETDHVRGSIALRQILVESLRGYFGKLIELLFLPQRIEMVIKVLPVGDDRRSSSRRRRQLAIHASPASLKVIVSRAAT